MTYASASDGSHRLLVGPTQGTFHGQVQQRVYEIRIHGAHRPQSVTVDGRKLDHWSWDANAATAIIPLPERAVRDRIRVEWSSGKP